VQVTDHHVKGAVYTMADFNGKLLSGINSKIQLYTWSPLPHSGGFELRRECGHHGHILALHIATRGDFIIVGDLMKSMSLLVYKAGSSELEEVAPARPPAHPPLPRRLLLLGEAVRRASDPPPRAPPPPSPPPGGEGL
jgi:hypothetical protein